MPLKNRQKYNEYHRKYKSLNEQWRYRNRTGHLLSVAKRTAKIKNLDFDLTLEDIVIPEVCPVFQIPLFFTKGKRTDNTPSVDRKNNTKGYIKDNIQILSWKANRLKSDVSLEDLVRLGEWAKSCI